VPDPHRTETAAPAPLTPSLADTADTAPGGPTRAVPSDALAVAGYELGEEIGHGGMGVVHRARDRELDREVAVKILLPKYASGSSTAKRFVDEARITAQLQHPVCRRCTASAACRTAARSWP
jgi:serine/threonine-protein kinase